MRLLYTNPEHIVKAERKGGFKTLLANSMPKCKKNTRLGVLLQYLYFKLSFAVFIEEISIRRITPHWCKIALDTSVEIRSAFCAISIQYSVS